MQEAPQSHGRAADEARQRRRRLGRAQGRPDPRRDGLHAEDADLPVSAFSGGWKMRIGLGKILLQEPQVILLDEPTNHMDLESVEWLERYLIEQTIRPRAGDRLARPRVPRPRVHQDRRDRAGRRALVQRQLPHLPQAEGGARRTGDEANTGAAEGDQGAQGRDQQAAPDESAAASRPPEGAPTQRDGAGRRRARPEAVSSTNASSRSASRRRRAAQEVHRESDRRSTTSPTATAARPSSRTSTSASSAATASPSSAPTARASRRCSG